MHMVFFLFMAFRLENVKKDGAEREIRTPEAETATSFPGSRLTGLGHLGSSLGKMFSH